MIALLLIVAGFFARQTPAPSQPVEAGLSLDYEFFKTRVQPIFLNKRPGNARCYVCHRGTGGTTRRMAADLPAGALRSDPKAVGRFFLGAGPIPRRKRSSKQPCCCSAMAW